MNSHSSKIHGTNAAGPEARDRMPVPHPIDRRYSPNAGILVLRILAAFDKAGVAYVYLRNYKGLPESVGHDVDLLIPRGMRKRALQLVRSAALENGWRLLRIAEFSPLAVFLVDAEGDHCIHLDLFDRIERHWLEFGNAEGILKRRSSNETVFHPGVGDEVFLNICTRLIYHGLVRDKHKAQANDAVMAGFEDEIRSAFIDHLGSPQGHELADAVIRGEWLVVESSTESLRWTSLLKWGLKSPQSAARGAVRYLGRTMRRLIRPPGPFIIFEGVDGVGKSTIIREIVPLLEEITGLGGTVEFHWKPCAKSIRTTNEPPPSQNPRGKPARGKTASLLFLAYHWLGFWLGWLRWVYPSLTRSISVVGDRYATDLYLDPLRFRLSLPDWILFWAAQSVPKGIVIALVADPQIVTDRKHELTHAEISEYQQRLDHLAKRDKSVFIVNANGAPATIVAEVRNSILKCLERKTQQRL